MQHLMETLNAMTREWLQVLTRMVHDKNGISKHDGGIVRPQTRPCWRCSCKRWIQGQIVRQSHRDPFMPAIESVS